MFGKGHTTPQIDKEQLQLLKNAQKRIKQKKRLYVHFVVFLIGSLFFILLNLALGLGKEFKIFETDWFVFAILIWLFLLLYHVFNVFITHKFMGKDWETRELQKLVSKQEERIGELEQNLEQADRPEGLEKKKSELTLIVAAAENNAIGKDNSLIWHLSDDLKRFKMLTKEHHIIMGRKTFESLSKPLPNRTHIVVTRQTDYRAPQGVIIARSLEDAISAAKSDRQPFIIGGGEIYKQAMTIAHKIEITRVHETFEADTFFPEIDTTIWKETANSFHKKDTNNEYDFSYITYVRV